MTQKSAFEKDLTGVKVCGIILLVIGIIAAILSILIVIAGPLLSAGASMPGYSGELAEGLGFAPTDTMSVAVVGVFLTVMGIVMLVASILDIVTGCFGIHGAKHPDHITPFWVLSIISLVISIGSGVTSIVMTALGGSDLYGNLVTCISSNAASIVFAACCVFYAGRVRTLERSGAAGRHAA